MNSADLDRDQRAADAEAAAMRSYSLPAWLIAAREACATEEAEANRD